MAKRPLVSKDMFTVTFPDGTTSSREIQFAQSPSATYRWGVLLPQKTRCGELGPEGVWCRNQDDATYVAKSLCPPGGYAVARFTPEMKQS